MKILLIEDDADIAAFLSMELEHEGYAVSVERDGPSGLQAALAGGADLILLTSCCPVSTGWRCSGGCGLRT